tara:strand:+ start:11245 stop:11697 length:453 start_codon:yes stop_codon:yes gene_type:complete
MLVKKAISFSAISIAMSIIGSLSMIILLSQHANAADLTINISDIEQGKGHVLVALFTGKENYNEGKSVKATKVKADNKMESVVFKDLVDGEYAVKMYQDENDNTELDRNIMGIPKEGYGFSNNVGMFGTPKYKEAKFIVKNNTIIEVDLF